MDDKDVIIGQLMRQNTELQQHVCELESIVKQQQNVIAELQDKIARLSKFLIKNFQFIQAAIKRHHRLKPKTQI